MSIRALTRSQDWTEPQRRMMRKAGQVLGLRALGLAAAARLCWSGGFGLSIPTARHRRQPADDSQRSHQGDIGGRDHRRSRRHQGHRSLPTLDRPRPEEAGRGNRRRIRKKLHASLWHLAVDPTQVEYLETRLLGATQGELSVLREILLPHRSRLSEKLWSDLERARPEDPHVLTTAGFLARFEPDSSRWSELGAKVAHAFVTLNPLELGFWLNTLR